MCSVFELLLNLLIYQFFFANTSVLCGMFAFLANAAPAEACMNNVVVYLADGCL